VFIKRFLTSKTAAIENQDQGYCRLETGFVPQSGKVCYRYRRVVDVGQVMVQEQQVAIKISLAGCRRMKNVSGFLFFIVACSHLVKQSLIWPDNDS
jgi:hypothetical protein